MLSPSLLASTPFRSKTAFEDMIGAVSLMHNVLLNQVSIATATSPARYTLDPAAPPDDLLESIQAQHAALARALGIEQPPDLQSFNLRDPTDFASFTFLLAEDLTRLRDAAGVV